MDGGLLAEPRVSSGRLAGAILFLSFDRASRIAGAGLIVGGGLLAEPRASSGRLAGAILFLPSDRASRITGAGLIVDGGLLAEPRASSSRRVDMGRSGANRSNGVPAQSNRLPGMLPPTARRADGAGYPFVVAA